MDGVINMTQPLTTWTELESARDAVADGEIFAKGVNADADGGYEVRLRRHGRDAVAELRVLGTDDWQPVDSDPDEVTGTLGVIDLRDIDTEVDFYPVR